MMNLEVRDNNLIFIVKSLFQMSKERIARLNAVVYANREDGGPGIGRANSGKKALTGKNVRLLLCV